MEEPRASRSKTEPDPRCVRSSLLASPFESAPYARFRPAPPNLSTHLLQPLPPQKLIKTRSESAGLCKFESISSVIEGRDNLLYPEIHIGLASAVLQRVRYKGAAFGNIHNLGNERDL